MRAAPLLSYYGDDLTGSTDVMEALSSRGVPTALFLDIPSASLLHRLGPLTAIGLAGTSRSETPAWMEQHLPQALGWLRGLRASFCHYKVCSTFDSSPDIGSIGCAIDIGATLFNQVTVPLVVGAPQLRRYTAFGNLFAAYQGQVTRIDRHPVMSRHPVTPMTEADLRLHLAHQTKRRVILADLALLAAADAPARIDELVTERPGILLFDVADAASQRTVGAALWRLRRDGGLFVAGSSGVEYALLTAWEQIGIACGSVEFASPGAVDRLAVVSGSCSPTTERQIRYALGQGFAGVAVDPRAFIDADGEQLAAIVAQGLAALQSGHSVILYTALGPASDLGAVAGDDRHTIGRGLGRMLRALVERAGLLRAVIAGGDTSSHALRELDIGALTTCLPLPQTPGSPLCTGHSERRPFDGLQVALKGGQVGNDDYFVRIREGAA